MDDLLHVSLPSTAFPTHHTDITCVSSDRPFCFGGICTALIEPHLLSATRYARTLVLLGGDWGILSDGYWVALLYAPELRALYSSVFTNTF